MLVTTRDNQEPCAGKNCPGLHIDREAGTATWEGTIGGPAALGPAGPGEGYVTMPLDTARRIAAEALDLS